MVDLNGNASEIVCVLCCPGDMCDGVFKIKVMDWWCTGILLIGELEVSEMEAMNYCGDIKRTMPCFIGAWLRVLSCPLIFYWRRFNGDICLEVMVSLIVIAAAAFWSWNWQCHIEHACFISLLSCEQDIYDHSDYWHDHGTGWLENNVSSLSARTGWLVCYIWVKWFAWCSVHLHFYFTFGITQISIVQPL